MLAFYLLKFYLLLLFSRLSNNIRTRTVAGSVSWLYRKHPKSMPLLVEKESLL